MSQWANARQRPARSRRVTGVVMGSLGRHIELGTSATGRQRLTPVALLAHYSAGLVDLLPSRQKRAARHRASGLIASRPGCYDETCGGGGKHQSVKGLEMGPIRRVGRC